eukprot:GHVL01019572.1.p2 GENE.GHVL01019572.1~~GHVL01019572.1.p2  ORF type:complete len:156 (-),score=46.75 GHVL01019572.1:547-1014(-)
MEILKNRINDTVKSNEFASLATETKVSFVELNKSISHKIEDCQKFLMEELSFKDNEIKDIIQDRRREDDKKWNNLNDLYDEFEILKERVETKDDIIKDDIDDLKNIFKESRENMRKVDDLNDITESLKKHEQDIQNQIRDTSERLHKIENQSNVS